MNLDLRSSMPACLAACLTLAVPAVFAQTFDAVRLDAGAPGQDGGAIGVAVVTGPEYPGSSDRRTLVVPVLDYQWANGWFAGVSNGIGYNFGGDSKLQYGLRITADLGRKQRRSDALRGMGDIDPQAEVGAFFNYALPLGFFLTSSLRYGSGNDNKGALLDLGAGYSLALSPQWRLDLGSAVTVANAAHMQSFFGVTSTQAATSGYKQFTPGAGVRDIRASAALSHQFDRRLWITAALSASTLGRDAKHSPLNRKTSTASGLVAMGWAF